MIRSLSRLLCGVCVLYVLDVAAQVPQVSQPPEPGEPQVSQPPEPSEPQVFQPPDPSEPQVAQPPGQSDESGRQAWLTYERELRAWCTAYYPVSFDICVETEMAKYGVSAAFFAALQAQPQPQGAQDARPVTDESPAPSPPAALPSPASANALHGWTWGCRTDPINNAWTCSARQADLYVAIAGYARRPLVWVAEDRQRMPGSLVALQLDGDTAYQVRQMWTGASAHAIITRMLTAQIAHTRYTAWPAEQGVESDVSLDGFAEVWRTLKQALVASQ